MKERNEAQTIRRRLLSLLALLPFAALLPAARADDATATPDGLVKTMSNSVLDAIKADKSLQSGDVAKLNALVDQKVLPYVNFERMTQLSVGRGWRQASPDQRTALVKEFRELLVRTYSGAMSKVKDQSVQLKPFRAAATDTDVVVRSQIVGGGADPIQLDYRLEKTDAGWKIYDVNVLGVWLVETYKTQFASEINQGGIDGLIKSLQDRNHAATAASK